MKKLHRKDLNDKRLKKIVKPKRCDHSSKVPTAILVTGLLMLENL